MSACAESLFNLSEWNAPYFSSAAGARPPSHITQHLSSRPQWPWLAGRWKGPTALRERVFEDGAVHQFPAGPIDHSNLNHATGLRQVPLYAPRVAVLIRHR